jgi:DNA-binding PadR family transcriptional regulator
MRLADRGWLETAWEREIPAGRPRRHLYRLTGAGLELASRLAAERTEAARAKRARLRLRTGGAQ